MDPIADARRNLTNGLKLIKELEKMIELWKPISGYDNYEVSNKGRVRNMESNRILKPQDHKGYKQVSLSKGTAVIKRIHNLVADAFLENTEKKLFVDHIDNDKHNNNVHNLRWCTKSENKQNTKPQSNNTSGIKGVSFDKRSGKYHAYIWLNRKRSHIGYFSTLEEAKTARQKKAEEMFGEFVNQCEK